MIETKILEINKRLLAMVSGREVRMQHPSDEALYITPEERSFLERTTASGFWNHYLNGSAIVLACMEIDWATHTGIPVNSDQINMFQGKSTALLRLWKNNPNRKSDELEEASIDACTQVFTSFNWAENPELVLQLKKEVGELGDCFMRLDGRTPLG